jgi:hypothetical protein
LSSAASACVQLLQHGRVAGVFGVAEALVDGNSQTAAVEELRYGTAREVVERKEFVGWK